MMYYYYFLIFASGIFLRFYNYNFDDLWYDEVLSFWISDPKSIFKESIANHNLVEGQAHLLIISY